MKKKIDKQELQILTINGFKNLSDCKVGEVVYDSKGNKTTIKSIKSIISPCYTLKFNMDLQIPVDENQIIENTRTELISNKRERDKNKHYTNKRIKIYDNIHRAIPMKEFYNVFTTRQVSSLNSFSYKTFMSTFKGENNSKKLILDPYLLGLLLGDGNLAGSYIGKDGLLKGTPVYTINTMDDPDIYKEFKKLIKSYGDDIHEINKDGRAVDIRINKGHIRSLLEHIHVWGHKCYTKWVPIEYLISNKENRLQILRGLMDTDGTCYVRYKPNGKLGNIVCEFDNTSEQLVRDIGFLVCSLGGAIDRIYKKKCKYKNKCGEVIEPGTYCYRYCIRMPKDISIFNSKRKKEKEKLCKTKKYKLSYLERSIKGIEFNKNKRKFTKITLTNGADSFIGNYFIKIHV